MDGNLKGTQTRSHGVGEESDTIKGGVVQTGKKAAASSSQRAQPQRKGEIIHCVRGKNLCSHDQKNHATEVHEEGNGEEICDRVSNLCGGGE